MVDQTEFLDRASDERLNLQSSEACNRYLIFEIDGEVYGVCLLDIKEVLNNRECKPVPYMKDYFLGIINLRGKIVSVLDLRLKFRKNIREDKEGFIIILEAANSQVGVVVDDILTVENIDPSEIDSNPHLELDFPVEFFIGVGKKKDRLINLVELSKILTKEDMRVLKK
jgi:purine-binding chemotaxis protein CheW